MNIAKKDGALITIAKIYLLVLSVFSLFRIILFFTELGRINFQEVDIRTILEAFIMGVRFDLVISGYIIALPTVVLCLQDIFKINYRPIVKTIFYFLLILFIIAFIICAADIPFFNEFYTRFSITAFDWIDSPKFVFDMIRQEPKYFMILFPMLLLIYFFRRILKKQLSSFKPSSINTPLKIVFSVIALGLIFIGIRGRVNMNSPIKVGTAYFCNHSFLNQLGLNPVFTLIRSSLDAQKKDNEYVQLMPLKSAFNLVRKELNLTNTDSNTIALNISADLNLSQRKANVIYIIMESMSAAKMKQHGCKKYLTPFLDSLLHEGLYFENHYSAGIHTYNGIFSSLFSFPALYRQRIMDNISVYNGISSSLEKQGYSTTYVTTHDEQFDNVAGFLKANGFDKIISDKDYPNKEIKTAMGCTDHFMYNFSLPYLDSMHKTGKPFFTTFMTGSDHGPYFIPDYFKARNEKTEDQAVEFADWSLRKFMDSCSKKEWFDNTLFVFVADHGKPINVRYTIPINFCHTPLLFFGPKLIDSTKIFTKPANQMDVFPTTMGILNLPYLKNNLGVNLLTENRPFAIFNYDDRIGVIDEEYLLVLRKSGEQELFHYKDIEVKNIIKLHPERVKKMRDYAYANMQVYQELLKSKKLFVKEVN